MTKNGETTPLCLKLPLPHEQIAATAGDPDGPSPGMTDDYLFRLTELNGRIAGAQKITDLNAFAGRLSELSELERVLFTGAVEITGCCDIADGDEILHNLDCFEVTPNAGDYKTLGRKTAAEQFANLPPDILEHLDYERLGKIRHEDGASAFVSGHRVFHNGQEFDAVNHGAEPLQGHCLKLRLVSDENADGVWIKFPLYESGQDDFERGEEIQVALTSLKADSLESCRAAECVCKYPSLNRCVEAHADAYLTDLVWMARNFSYAESELSQYGKEAYEKLTAALELEDCRNLSLAADITQNLRCYDFAHDPEALAESYLERHKVDPLLTTCFDLKSLGEKLVADCGMVRTANGLISHNGAEFIYDCYDPLRRTPEQEYKEIRFMCPLKVQTDPESDLAEEYGDFISSQDMADLPGCAYLFYEDEISDAIEKEHMPEHEEGRGLAVYFSRGSVLADKVAYIWPSVTVLREELYGVIDVRLTQDLSPAEHAELTDFLTGQMSDGWGEGFEQHPIRTDRGDLYVSFWHSGDDYFLKPEREVIGMEPTHGDPEQGFSPTMGGM